MTNGEKYKTAQERAMAFEDFCNPEYMTCISCPLEKYNRKSMTECRYAWLDLEAEEEKPLPCPFCGAECKFEFAYIKCTRCNYTSGAQLKREYAIAAHNRVAKKCLEVAK